MVAPIEIIKKKLIAKKSKYFFVIRNERFSYNLRYVGFGKVPPVYPTRVLITPFCTPKMQSGDQKQAMANVACFVGVSISCNTALISKNEKSSTFKFR